MHDVLIYAATSNINWMVCNENTRLNTTWAGWLKLVSTAFAALVEHDNHPLTVLQICVLSPALLLSAVCLLLPTRRRHLADDSTAGALLVRAAPAVVLLPSWQQHRPACVALNAMLVGSGDLKVSSRLRWRKPLTQSLPADFLSLSL